MVKAPRLIVACLLILTALLLASGPLEAKKKKKDPEKIGVIAGTVFQQVGFSLRGATVIVTPAPEGASEEQKEAVETVTTDNRGEFAVRVPAGAMRYTVRAEAEGWQPEEKVVVVEWDQRVDISFRLKPASDGTAK